MTEFQQAIAAVVGRHGALAVAKLCRVSRSTPLRWASGKSAPAELARQPILNALRKQFGDAA